MKPESGPHRRRGTPISDSLGADLQTLGGLLASHTRGLDAYLNRQARRINQRQQALEAETRELLLPTDLDLEAMTTAELQALCRQHRLRGWSRLRRAELLTFVRMQLQPAPVPDVAAPELPLEAPAGASRSERLLLLLLHHLGVTPEAVQAAWLGDDSHS